MTNRLPCFRGTFETHGKQPPLCIWDVAQYHTVLYHITGGLSAYLGNRTIFHRVMASAVPAGVNLARGAPFFGASGERAHARTVLDGDAIEHHDANVEVIIMKCFRLLTLNRQH